MTSFVKIFLLKNCLFAIFHRNIFFIRERNIFWQFFEFLNPLRNFLVIPTQYISKVAYKWCGHFATKISAIGVGHGLWRTKKFENWSGPAQNLVSLCFWHYYPICLYYLLFIDLLYFICFWYLWFCFVICGLLLFFCNIFLLFDFYILCCSQKLSWSLW